MYFDGIKIREHTFMLIGTDYNTWIVKSTTENHGVHLVVTQ